MIGSKGVAMKIWVLAMELIMQMGVFILRESLETTLYCLVVEVLPNITCVSIPSQ